MELYNFIPNKTQRLIDIIRDLTSLYKDYFGKELDECNIVIDSPDPKAPVTYRSERTINLKCQTYEPCQFYYQLSHELCHWMIPRDVPQRLRWLEETIAVLASVFFYSKLQTINPVEMFQYLSGEFKYTERVSIIELHDSHSNTIKILENNSQNFTDYPRYRSIALFILPIVNMYPAFWKAVPFLCDVEPGPDLKTSLARWLALIENSDIHTALSQVVGALL